MHKELGRDTGWTADPNCPRDIPLPYDAMISNKTSEGVDSGYALQGLSGNWLVGGEQFSSFASLVFLRLYFPV